MYLHKNYQITKKKVCNSPVRNFSTISLPQLQIKRRPKRHKHGEKYRRRIINIMCNLRVCTTLT